MKLVCCLFLFLLFNERIIISRSDEDLRSKFFNLLEEPDHELILRTGNEIKQVQFSKYNENVFHDSGNGIKEENWNKIVQTMGKFYKIPEEGIEQLEVARLMDNAEKKVHNFEIGGKGPGEFGYLRIAVEKNDGVMNYILAGTQIKFNLAPYTEEKKTTLDLYFVKFESIVSEAVIPQAVEENLKEYFINKALVAAGKRYGRTEF